MGGNSPAAFQSSRGRGQQHPQRARCKKAQSIRQFISQGGGDGGRDRGDRRAFKHRYAEVRDDPWG